MTWAMEDRVKILTGVVDTAEPELYNVIDTA
jgi:hypothetical protein